ncbi:SMP-30/gluconolactonase/LRE family protein [Hymenobacter terrenus]|uniref:SMP-30/gluconolactonase/LRE family protein n=1 Tax=Hymenobacter terrenus TaxID=1629124 RepID=UPI0006191ABF|nr:L-dopachrome tautomerase-related protein [Hymenobacter terrenus]
MRLFRNILLGLLVLVLALALTLWLRHGGGEPYADLTTGQQPLVPAAGVEAYYTSQEPVGNVAATPEPDRPTRVFFTIHPESHPTGTKLYEILPNRQAVPYPSEAGQTQLITPLGVFVDRQQRLWVIDHGNHGLESARLLAYDLATGRLAINYHFPASVAGNGSFLNDLTVSPDGRYVFVADVSFWRKRPALIMYDVARQRSRALLVQDSTVTAQNWLIRNQLKDMSFFGGIVNLKAGIDGLSVDPAGQFVYYAPMSHQALFRVPITALADTTLSAAQLAGQVQRVGRKPLSDGIAVDANGRVLITDVEHQGLSLMEPTGRLQTLVRDPRIRWADGLAFGGDGYVYLADSAIPDQMLRSADHIREAAPYTIFRFRWPASGQL